MTAPALMTEPEAATYLTLSRRALAYHRERLTGPAFVRFGRSIRYRQADLDAWIDAHVEDCKPKYRPLSAVARTTQPSAPPFPEQSRAVLGASAAEPVRASDMTSPSERGTCPNAELPGVSVTTAAPGSSGHPKEVRRG